MKTKNNQVKTLIIIPVYNGEDFIERTLTSCLSQTVPAPIWVVDNKSTDRTREIVFKYTQKHPNVRLIVNERNLGRIGNWNRCLELFEESPYEYIKYVFSGDEILPECIAESEKAFALDTEIGAVAFPYEFVYRDGTKVITGHPYQDHLFSIKEINRVNIEDGGLLGAIICNVYSKRWIRGYRFSEFFIGKADFDYQVLSQSKAYYRNKVLARYNLDGHRTHEMAQDYFSEAEFVFNRAYHLERVKSMFSEEEYRAMRERLFLDFTLRGAPYYPISTLVVLVGKIINYVGNVFWQNIKKSIKKSTGYERKNS